MNGTDENRTLTICQATEHAMLIPWGRFSQYLQMRERIQAVVPPRCHEDATPGGNLVLEFGLASLSGCEYLEELNLGSHPLVKDQAVQDAWGFQFRHYTTVSRFLYELSDSDIEAIEAEMEAMMRPYIRSAVHEVLCHQEFLTLCGDLTGRPVSAYSETYPPDTVFGYMANRLRKGHQAALVTLKGLDRRVHVAAFHHRGDTVSGPCLREMVRETECRCGYADQCQWTDAKVCPQRPLSSPAPNQKFPSQVSKRTLQSSYTAKNAPFTWSSSILSPWTS